MIYYCICTCSHDIKNDTCSHPYEYINFDRCIHGFQHVFSVSTCPPAKMCAVCINLYWCIYIFKDTPACIYTYMYIYTSYKLYIYIILHILLAESPRHSTCEATHPSVGHGVDGAAWFPANISSVSAAECGSICQYIFEAATICALKFQLVGSGFQLTCEYPFVFIHFQNGKTMISTEFVPPGCSFRLVATASRCSNDSHWLNQ